MSVKVETPVYKTEVVKVSNMEPVEMLNDDSTFLVIHDGYAHKISAKALKENMAAYTKSIVDTFLREALKKSRDQEKQFSALSSACTENIDNLGKTLNRTLQTSIYESKQRLDDYAQSIENSLVAWKSDALSTVVDSVDVVKSMFDECQRSTEKMILKQNLQLSTECQQLKSDVSVLVQNELSELKTNIEKQNKTVENSIETSVQRKLEKYEIDSSDQIAAISSQIAILSSASDEVKNYSNSLSSACKEISTDISKLHRAIEKDQNDIAQSAAALEKFSSSSLSSTAEISSYSTEISAAVCCLSANETQLDQRLYGLTVEEIDENLNVTPHVLISGDIIELSAEIQKLSKQQSKILSMLEKLDLQK